MSSNLNKTYKLAGKIFPGISKICIQCNTCCRTYGWLLEEEAKNFIKRGYPVVEINGVLNCIDSFQKDKRGRKIIEKIPRCIFYQRTRRCKIHKIRSMDCRFYPAKVKVGKEKFLIGLSLGCKYIASLSEHEKEIICRNIVAFFKSGPKKIIKEFLDLNQKIASISKPKRFWMKKLLEIDIIDKKIKKCYL